MNEYYQMALNYCSYPLCDRSQLYDDNVPGQITKVASRLEVRLELQGFNISNPIIVLSFLQAFQMACDCNGIYEGTTVWLPHFLNGKPAGAALNTDTRLSSLSRARQDGNLTSDCQLVKSLLLTYAAIDIISEAEMDIMNFKQPPGNSAIKYAMVFLMRAQCCRPVYEEHASQKEHLLKE